MELLDLIKAYAIAQGAHTAGHFRQATNQENHMRDVPMGLSYKKLAELWNIPDKWSKGGTPQDMSHEDYLVDNARKATDIHGAGFAMQDRVRNLIPDIKTQQDVSKMNALIKSFYLLGGPSKLSSSLIPGGDIGGMERSSGNPRVKALLMTSILSDLVKSQGYMKNKSLDFTTINGAPGLKFNMEF